MVSYMHSITLPRFPDLMLPSETSERKEPMLTRLKRFISLEVDWILAPAFLDLNFS